jgi:hypothetical protein
VVSFLLFLGTAVGNIPKGKKTETGNGVRNTKEGLGLLAFRGREILSFF